MLANGHSKNRMARNVSARRSLTWDLLFLSSGEQRLSDKLRESGQKIKGGQEIRLCDIEARTGKHGLFENLHGFRSGQEFSDFLRRSSKEYYGLPIRAFLAWLVKVDLGAIQKNWREFQRKFITDVLLAKENVPSEVFRVASRRLMVENAVAELQSAANEAVETLKKNLHCENPAVEIRAAQIILDNAMKGVEMIDILERLEKLEDELESKN